ncbi:hypothetical protein QYE76_036078 [Lolium multiflorum]|uniref:Transposase (putative) gypsy type domain-containing protein n=1 Tax=Lolium multiflorum TaxID=4521 RepID=A0AAD8R0A6_LOLMU|nr:hypothetical protein QYE76_036078 [Lolium multiflorum]
MAAKVQEAEQKKGLKARNREGEKGQRWPSEITDSELRAFEKEGLIAPDTWSFNKNSITPTPEPDERVFTKDWVERGISLPPSEFFLSVLSTYGLQPHNICPNSFLLLSNFATLYEGYLGVRPDVCLWQFFYRVKKETNDKIMVNCGSMIFVLHTKRIFPTLASHESVRYWNTVWFYVKNISVPGIHDGLPAFVNKPPEELTSWSFIPALAQYSELEKMARRISWLVHDGLTGMDLTLSWFTRRIQPLKFNKRLIYEYSGVDDQLRANKDNLPTDSLNKRIRTLVKLTRGQELNSLAEDGFRDIFRIPTNTRKVEEDPEDKYKGEEQIPKKKTAPRAPKRPRTKASGTDVGTSGEASATKAKTTAPPCLDSKKAERARIKLLATAGRGSHPQLHGATRTRRSPLRGLLPRSPSPVSSGHLRPLALPLQFRQVPPTQLPNLLRLKLTPHLIPPPKLRWNSNKAEATAKDANFGDPSDLYATPKAYSTKLFSKLTEAEKWELKQDLLNSMLNNAWGKADAECPDIQNHKRDIREFFD